MCCNIGSKGYKVDGFRFDLVKGLGNNDSYANSGDNATNAFNPSRIDRMKRLHSYMKEVNPDAYFINENLAGRRGGEPDVTDGELKLDDVNEAGGQFAMGFSDKSNLNRMLATQDEQSTKAGSTVSYLESRTMSNAWHTNRICGAQPVSKRRFHRKLPAPRSRRRANDTRARQPYDMAILRNGQRPKHQGCKRREQHRPQDCELESSQ